MEPAVQTPAAPGHGELTQLLRLWSEGDQQASEHALLLLYDDLRRAAHGIAWRERPDHTLEPTAVVHEAWIQMVGARGVQASGVHWQSREHFLGVAARTMRRVLVDHARRRSRAKRGGHRRRVPLGESIGAGPAEPDAAWALHLELDRALEALERFAPVEARVVEARFYGGLTLEETAEVLGVSRRTIVRTWRRARAWLRAELGGAEART